MTRSAVLFDMGSVLIGWEARPPYRAHFDSEEALTEFLGGTFREIYDAVHDGDGSVAECLAPVRRRRPEAHDLIDVYEGWGAFITGVMEDSVAVVRDLHRRGVPLYGLSNWPAQTWPPTRVVADEGNDYAFLDLFEDIWISGEHKLRKPDPASYRSALKRFGLEAREAVFVDDLPHNVEAARELGIHAIHFTDAPTLRIELESLALL